MSRTCQPENKFDHQSTRRKDYYIYAKVIALIRICRSNILLCYGQGAQMACKNGIMMILPNSQDTASCNYKVLGTHTEMCKYSMYYETELGI